MATALAPWLPRALQVLDVRRGDRLLLVAPGDVEIARAVADVLGSKGTLTVVEPRRGVAEAIANRLEGAEVLATTPAIESYGSFDGVLATPLVTAAIPASTWAGLVARNLRPGGRFAVDLPAPAPLPEVTAAAADSGLPFATRLAEQLSGVEPEELFTALHDRGLRRVEPLLGTHLLAFDSPYDAVDFVGVGARLDDDERLHLGEAIARRLRSTTKVEIVAHRAAAAGMR